MKPLLLASLLSVLIVSVGVPGVASAQNGGLAYEQRGSRVSVQRDGNVLTITYVQPSEQRRAEGVAPGTVLFSGAVDANGYAEGMAWLYGPRCEGIDYFVYGDFRPGEPFKLAGAAPVLADNCAIVDNVFDTGDANLIFTPAAAAPASTAALSPGDKVCVSGVERGKSLPVLVGPTDDHGHIALLSSAECNISVIADCRGDWCPVRGPANVLGWAHRANLAPQP